MIAEYDLNQDIRLLRRRSNRALAMAALEVDVTQRNHEKQA